MWVKKPRKCRSHEAQPSRGTSRRSDEEHTKTEQTLHMKPSSYEQRGTAKEDTDVERSVRQVLVWGCGGGGGGGGGELKPFLLARNLHYENKPIQIFWKFDHQKMKIFRQKKSDIFHISAQNLNCGYSLEPPRRGGSNEYPQSMFLSRNMKNNVYTCKPQFLLYKSGV